MVAIFPLLHKLRSLAVLAATALCLTGCDVPSVTPPITGPADFEAGEPLRVALLVPRSSQAGGDAILAENLVNAAQMAIGDLQGVVAELQIYDTEGIPEVAAKRGVEAADSGARIILGPIRGESANAVAVAVRDHGLNVLSFSNNSSLAGGNHFVLGTTFENIAGRLIGFAAEGGNTTVIVVHSADTGGEYGRRAIEEAISRTPGARLAGTVAHKVSRQGIDDSIPAIVDLTHGTNANTIFFTATTSGALPLYSRLLPENGISNQSHQFIGLTRWDIPARTLGLSGLQGGLFALPDPGKAGQFRARYQRAYGTQPHSIATLAYDGIAAIGALAGTRRSGKLTAPSLTQRAGFEGAGGVFRFRPDGTNQRGLAVAVVRNPQAIIIDPAPTDFSGS